VLIEIGGNDLLDGTASATFEANLDRLLAAATPPPGAPARTVIMFELPLFPHRIAYGRIQRRLAAKYRVQLIPKRYFVQAFRAGTSDGLHLSPAGARYVAGMVESLMESLVARPDPVKTRSAATLAGK
jgi:acyl-CoA thioesterase I